MYVYTPQQLQQQRQNLATPPPDNTFQRLVIIILLIVVAVVALGAIFLAVQHKKTAHSASPGLATKAVPAASFNKQRYSLADPTSPWVIVNKQHPLIPLQYAPNTTVPTIPLRLSKNDPEMLVGTAIATPLEQLVNDAKAQHITLMLASGYRSYDAQNKVYTGYVQTQGQGAADTESARPGYSEHQAGLAVDLEPTSRTCEVDACFANTPEGKWLAANAYAYGFIIRYPADKQDVTGYEYEPWHIRYVGPELAAQMHAEHIETLEEFFGVPGGTSYKD